MNAGIPVLYLEDDAALASATARALGKRGFAVTYCVSISAARVVLHQQEYERALLDLRLDDGTSLELIDALLTRLPEIKIVVLTGYASIATAVQAIKMGAVNYLSKPASIEQILRAFDEVEEPPDAEADEILPLRRREWEQIQQVLKENNGNISATARQLKMHRRTLQRKLSKKPVAE
jgi:two-component system response regulator RegA